MTAGTWEYRSELDITSHPGQVTELAQALNEGWEPFAVTDDRRDQFGIQNSRTVHLRRFVPAAVSATVNIGGRVMNLNEPIAQPNGGKSVGRQQGRRQR